jgi:hypothetical protein
MSICFTLHNIAVHSFQSRSCNSVQVEPDRSVTCHSLQPTPSLCIPVNQPFARSEILLEAIAALCDACARDFLLLNGGGCLLSLAWIFFRLSTETRPAFLPVTVLPAGQRRPFPGASMVVAIDLDFALMSKREEPSCLEDVLMLRESVVGDGVICP